MRTNLIYLNRQGVKIKVEYVNVNGNWLYITEDAFEFPNIKSLNTFMNKNGFYTLNEVMGSKSKCFNN